MRRFTLHIPVRFQAKCLKLARSCAHWRFSVDNAALPDDHVDQDGNDADRQQGEHEDDARRGVRESLLFRGTRVKVQHVDFHEHLLHYGVRVVTLDHPGTRLHAVGQGVVMAERAQGHRY